MAKLVTFDCYATLVDFNLRPATEKLLTTRTLPHNFNVEAFFNEFRVMRYQACLEPYMTYETMLHSTLRHVMTLHGLEFAPADGEAMVAAVKTFGPFPEVPAALNRLKEKYKIGIISNSDDEILRHNVELIGVDFDFVVSAEQVGAFKPKLEAFTQAWKIMGYEPKDVIHVAQGWEYDMLPTYKLDIAQRVWINRRGQPGSDSFQPYDELSDLTLLPETLGITLSATDATADSVLIGSEPRA